MGYYRSSFTNIFFAIFDFFDTFLRLEKISTNKLYTVFNQDEAAKQ